MGVTPRAVHASIGE